MTIGDEIPLARFLIERNKFNSTGATFRAFLPAPDLTLSTSRIDGLNMAEVWALGMAQVAKPRGKDLYGFAELGVKAYLDEGLVPDPDNVPERHVNIRGWPSSEEKDKQHSIAQALAARAILRRND